MVLKKDRGAWLNLSIFGEEAHQFESGVYYRRVLLNNLFTKPNKQYWCMEHGNKKLACHAG